MFPRHLNIYELNRILSLDSCIYAPTEITNAVQWFVRLVKGLINNIKEGTSEGTIMRCSHNGWGSHNCVHGDDAGVKCNFLSKLLMLKVF